MKFKVTIHVKEDGSKEYWPYEKGLIFWKAIPIRRSITSEEELIKFLNQIKNEHLHRLIETIYEKEYEV